MELRIGVVEHALLQTKMTARTQANAEAQDEDEEEDEQY